MKKNEQIQIPHRRTNCILCFTNVNSHCGATSVGFALNNERKLADVKNKGPKGLLFHAMKYIIEFIIVSFKVFEKFFVAKVVSILRVFSRAAVKYEGCALAPSVFQCPWKAVIYHMQV